MNKIEKMLDTLSKADINYKDRMDIDIFSETGHSEKAVSGTKYGAERYRGSKLRFIPALLFSFIIISGVCIYAANIRDITPLVNSSSIEETDAFEQSDTKNTGYKEFLRLDDEVMEMRFSLFGSYDGRKYAYVNNGLSDMRQEYVITDAEKCADILKYISDRRTGEKGRISDMPEELFVKSIDSDIPAEINDDINVAYFSIDHDIELNVIKYEERELIYITKEAKTKEIHILDKGTFDNIAGILVEYIKSTEKETVSVFPEIEVPETMTFITNKMNTAHIIDDAEKCSYIMKLISENCITKNDKHLISIPHLGKSLPLDIKTESYPYKFEIWDDIVFIPLQIEFTLPDNTKIAVLSAYYNDDLIIVKDGEKSYYKLKNCIYYELNDIIKEIEANETGNININS